MVAAARMTLCRRSARQARKQSYGSEVVLLRCAIIRRRRLEAPLRRAHPPQANKASAPVIGLGIIPCSLTANISISLSA